MSEPQRGGAPNLATTLPSPDTGASATLPSHGAGASTTLPVVSAPPATPIQGTPGKAPAPEPASGPPTAIIQVTGNECPSCRRANHPGVTRCAFCGASLDLGETLDPSAPNTVAQGTPLSLQGASLNIPIEPDPKSAKSFASASFASARSVPVSIGSEPPPPMSTRSLSRVSDSFDELSTAPIADPLIGVVVADRYRILEPLGRGGMGIVYKVEHVRIGKLLAMKLLTGELSRNPDVVRRFKQEALTASKLSSPNTVQVFDFGAAEGLTYLVMELVAGEDLGRTLRALGPMPFTRLGKIVIQVCSSLAEAHQKGIVHRDIKPENIMLLRARDGTDVAKVLDFGLAKLREGQELNDVTSQGAIVGTPYFMAPEQIRGEPVDTRSDIYALGALMYRALTGHYPFNGPTPMSVFTRHLTETPVPPNERAPERAIPAGASRLILKALSKAAADRFQKVEELQAALVEEVRAAGTSSVDNLLDTGELRKLTKAQVAAEGTTTVAPAVLATRDEVEAYERKLRRQKWGALASAGLVVAIAAGVGIKLATLQTKQEFTGVETEPNNTAAEANAVPYGKTVSGMLGQRIDPTHGDRDFYSLVVPSEAGKSSTVVRLRVTALPNFATCTMLYRSGFQTALGQYCVGRAGRDLVIPALALEPGRYLVAVMQDLDPYGGAAPFLYENVSDTYRLTLEPASIEGGQEVEPNDQVASANAVAPGSSITGTLAWARDEDVFCAPKDAGPIRFRARDNIRAAGSALEVTPVRDTPGAPVRVHPGSGKVTATDVQSPWVSEVMQPGDAPRCLRVRLTNDPWSGSPASVVPNGGSDPYVIEVEPAP